jgi:hypothetical protein
MESKYTVAVWRASTPWRYGEQVHRGGMESKYTVAVVEADASTTV